MIYKIGYCPRCRWKFYREPGWAWRYCPLCRREVAFLFRHNVNPNEIHPRNRPHGLRAGRA